MISPVGVASSFGAHAPHGLRQATLSAAADKLGISAQDLVTQLRSGLSMADVAQQKGVATDQLVSAVAGAVQSVATGGADATSIAQKIVDHKGGAEGHHRHHAGHGSAADATPSPFSTLSSMLGMSQDQLLSAFESGSSLSDLLSGSGLSLQSIETALGQSTSGSVVDTTA